MKTISSKTIDRTWKRINEASEDEGSRLIDAMAKDQPFIVAYLMAVEETLIADQERGRILLVGLLLWETLSAVNPTLRLVTVEDIETAEKANIAFLEELEAGSEMDHMEALRNLMVTYNQAALLETVVEALMEGNEEEPELAGDHIGLALLHLKTVLDCLDQ